MALTSPGVQVTVVDESFYSTAGPGTVPMIFVASAQNKLNGSSTGIAPGTLKENAERVYLITSQRELTENFGDPKFYTDFNNNPVNAGELNEYGLQTAYSALGVTNRVFVTRADVDLSELEGSAFAPSANPVDGTMWLDLNTTRYGIFVWNGDPETVLNGQTFTEVIPIIVNEEYQTTIDPSTTKTIPKTTIGTVGDYAILTYGTTELELFYKKGIPADLIGGIPASSKWIKVGSEEWIKEFPLLQGSKNLTGAEILGDDSTIEIVLHEGTTATTETLTFSDVGTTPVSVNDIITQINALTFGGSDTPLTAELKDSKFSIIYNKYPAETVYVEIINKTGTSGDAANTLGFETDQDEAVQGYTAMVEISPHSRVPEFRLTDSMPRPSGSLWIKTTEPGRGSKFELKRWSSATSSWESVEAPVYQSNASAVFNLDRTGGGQNLGLGSYYVKANINESGPVKEADFKILERANEGLVSARSAIIENVADPTTGVGPRSSFFTIGIRESLAGQESMSEDYDSPADASPYKEIIIELKSLASDADDIVSAINNAGFQHVIASVDASNRVVLEHELGGEIQINDMAGNLFSLIGFVPFNVNTNEGTTNFYYQDGTDPQDQKYVISGWKTLVYIPDFEAPDSLVPDGTLWYSTVIDEVDIMVNDGNTWRGYRNVYPDTDPQGPIVSASMPETQNDGFSPLVTGDLWVDTSDLENFPRIYKFSTVAGKWVLLDNTDQTTENGVLFADARQGIDGGSLEDLREPEGTIEQLLESDYLDPDAPEPVLYPRGMILWNLRRSGFNVKSLKRLYIDNTEFNLRYQDESMSDYYPHRWVTESQNNIDGSGSFGRKAQRKVVVQRMQAMLNSNLEIRDTNTKIFNLMAAPGYPELIGEMVNLNYDRGISAFVLGDTPARLEPSGTSINNWGENTGLAAEDGDDGLVTRDEYLGIYYPWGYTSDNLGNNIVVPPSHMMLRTIILSDQVSYPWFAPAGIRRGGITNASTSGYVTDEGEFLPAIFNEGLRSTLLASSINPITLITGAGLVAFGQKTRARGASALDRINVARLMVYLRGRMEQLCTPYIFEPNDKITRDQLKQAAEGLMLELVATRGIYDFVVVCDETNNTPARIDRQELWMDVALEPTKAVEFIYVPLRIKNTGEISGS